MGSEQLRKKLTELQHAVTGRVFCMSCQAEKPPEGGVIKETKNNRRRFVSAGCVDRIRKAKEVAQ